MKKDAFVKIAEMPINSGAGGGRGSVELFSFSDFFFAKEERRESGFFFFFFFFFFFRPASPPEQHLHRHREAPDGHPGAESLA